MSQGEHDTMISDNLSIRSVVFGLRRALRLAAMPLFVMLATTSSASLANSDYDTVESPYPLLDSEFLASNRNQTFWLDEHRVLFVGSDKPKPLTKNDPPAGPFGIYIWDTRDNSVSRYRRKIFGHLCYQDGWIHYTTSLNYPYRFASGPMGKELETTLVTVDDKRHFYKTHFFSKTTCRFHERSDYVNTQTPHRRVIPLGDNGSFLTVAQSHREPENALFFESGGNEGIRMQFKFRDFVSTNIKYYEFKKQYLISPLFSDRKRRNRWQVANCAPAWWLRADGEVTEACIPAGPWYAPASILVSPLRNGLAIVSHRVHDHEPSAGGLYLANESGHLKLLDGWVHGLSTSPDGCKLAFTHAPDSEAMAYRFGNGKTSLKMIDFCPKTD